MVTSICSNEEMERLREYLRHTHVAPLADLIGKRLVVTKGRIHLLSELGNLQTLWSDLGGLRSESILSSEKFRVRDALNVLESPKCADKTSLQTIRKYITRLSEIEMIITVKQEDDGEYRIYDGNKRSVAYYEVMKKQPGVNFKFFLLQPKSL